MDCETCGWPLKWEGSMRDGELVCGNCEANRERAECGPTSQLELYKAMVGQEARVPSPPVPVKPSNVNPGTSPAARDNITCGHCGWQDSILAGVNLSLITCPHCNTLGSFQIEDTPCPVAPGAGISATVKLQCNHCGDTMVAYRGYDLPALRCPTCRHYGTLEEVT